MAIEATSTPLTRADVRGRPDAAPNGRRWAGLLLIGLWAAWIGAAAWVGPWITPTSHLQSAASERKVLAWEQTDRSPGAPLLTPLYSTSAVPTGGFTYTSSIADAVLWRDATGRTWWSAPALEQATDVVPAGAGKADEAVSAWLRGHAPQAPGVTVAGADLWPNILRIALAVATLGLVALGPQPRRGTRWYWLWMTVCPMGLGALLFAVRELLRPLPAMPARRLRGVNGVALAVVVSLGVALVYSAVVSATLPF